MNNPQPTKRFMIEPSLMCNIKCKFCYHLHRYDTWKDTVKSFEDMKKEIDAGKARGNEWMDITGGEPTVYLHILKVIEYAHSIGLKVCIITNGIVSEKRTQELIDVKLDEFLVSRHGKANTHNIITNTGDGYYKQCEFLNQIKDKIQIRFNCVINKLNQNDLELISICLCEWNPKIVNFINFNPHHEWKNVDFTKQEIIADLNIVKSQLNLAIEFLEKYNIGVNVRYYPMCKIAEKYRRCICNDLHVMFDPYEWDYKTMPKTVERFYKWGVATSNANEEKGSPCNMCDLQNICGGVNKYFHKASTELYGEVLKPIQLNEKIDFYHYRKDATTIDII
jgi:MoaA/NifB/PqqE/SkfB family radical SAM enzyme